MALHDPRSDAELIAAINAGDAVAFEALYRRYRDWVVRLATRFAGHHEDALDVLQDTFAYLLRRVPALRLSARMTTFLYPVVRNLALTRRRKRARESDDPTQLDYLPAPEDVPFPPAQQGVLFPSAQETASFPPPPEISSSPPQPESAAPGAPASSQAAAAKPPPDRAAALGELATVLCVLPPPQREVLLMRFVDDMELAEIAAALAIPLGTVKSRLHNALQMLRADARTRRYFET